MAMQVLTVRGIEALKPRTKRYEVFDALTPSLAIRVTPSGHKSWVLYYRHHGRQRRLTLGRYPDRPLAEARSEAIHERGRILKGADPATEKQAGHAENDHTVQALYELYRSRKEKVLRSWSEVRRIMEKEVLPTWRHRRVADIRRRDVRELVEEKAQTAPDPGQPCTGAHLRAVHVCRRPGLDRSEPGVADQETGTGTHSRSRARAPRATRTLARAP